MQGVKVNLSTVRNLRKESKLSVKDIMKALNLQTSSAYYKKELGMIDFSLEEAKVLSELFNLTIEQLFFNN